MLLSSGLLVLASRCMAHMASAPALVSARSDDLAGITSPLSSSSSFSTAATSNPVLPQPSRQQSLQGRMHQAWLLVLSSSRFLKLVCAHVAITASVSSQVYFLRALVVARSLRKESRQTFFASLNTALALVILILQLTSTAAAIQKMGVQAAISGMPLLSIVGFVVVFIAPNPVAVSVVEVLRKGYAYAIAKPTKEVIFTAMTSQELAFKVLIDSLVGRAGDTISAAVFEVLDGRLRLGPRALAAAGVALCCLWLVVTLALGRVFRVRQQAHARATAAALRAKGLVEAEAGDPPVVTVVAASSSMRMGSRSALGT